MCEQTDGDEVDAGLSVGADVFEADAAGALEGDAALVLRTALHRTPDVVDAHVVEQDGFGADAQGLLQFVKIAELDLDWLGAAAIAHSPVKRGNDATRQCDVVVFNQNPVGKIEAVVHPSPASHCILIDDAKTGGGLARVKNAGLGARDGVDELSGQGGDAAHALKKIQHHALAGKQDASIVTNYGD